MINFLKRSFAVIFSIIISFYILEIILSVKFVDNYVNKNQKQRYCKDISKCDERNAYQVYKDSLDKEKIIIPNFTPVYNFQSKIFTDYATPTGEKIFPLSKISNQTTAMCNEDGEWIIYETDKYGFNNIYSDYKNKDIFILGDSYIEGHCSKPENNIAGYIEKNSKFKVINNGMAGSGPLMMLATLKEYASIFKPRKVIWYHFHNDIINLQRYEKNSQTLIRYLNEPNFDQNLVSKQDKVDSAIKLYLNKKISKQDDNYFFTQHFSYKTFFKLWYFRSVLKNFGLQTTGIKNKIVSPGINDYKLFEKILYKVKEIGLKKNIEIYFVFLPDITGVYPIKYEHYEKEDSRIKVMNIAKKIFKNKTFDITESLIENFYEPSDLFIGGIRGNHYTDQGYEFVAKKTLELFN